MRELLDPRQAVLGRVEAGLQTAAARTANEREHLAAPADRLLLQALERHDRVDEPHLKGL